MKAIEIKNFTFTYPQAEQAALRNVTLTVQPSEMVLLCGPSGSGKSTLLRQMKRSLAAYGEKSGEIFLLGKNIQEQSEREAAFAVGYVGQNPEQQIVTEKVWHELAFGLESMGLDQKTMKRRVSEMADFFGMEEWFHKKVSELSGGQKQILTLASVMVMQPKILLLDEPTAQLDPIGAGEFLATLKKINRKLGTTIVLTEHRLEEAFELVDRVVVLDGGQIRLAGTSGQVAASLCRAGEKDPMYLGLPSATRIYGALTEKRDLPPITVREGRLWLQEYLPDREEESRNDMWLREHLQEKKEAAGRKNAFGNRENKDFAAISVKDLFFRYPEAQTLLKGVTLQVNRGEWFTLLGGNGAGKSTLLKILCGILPFREGRIFIGEIPLERKREKEIFSRGLAYLPQNPQALFTEITVEEELLEALRGEGYTDEEKIRQLQKVAEQMELEPLLTAHPYDLSGGEQQRLALGKLLLRRPTVLLLDEPTKGLDPFFKEKLGRLLGGLKEQGITIFLVSHDIEFAAAYSDRCGLLFDGEILGVGTPGEFFGGNHFFTTAANAMAREYFPQAVTCEEVIREAKYYGEA